MRVEQLLDDGKETEALVRFDEVLSLDAHQAAALDGKKDAQERILARKTRDFHTLFS